MKLWWNWDILRWLPSVQLFVTSFRFDSREKFWRIRLEATVLWRWSRFCLRHMMKYLHLFYFTVFIIIFIEPFKSLIAFTNFERFSYRTKHVSTLAIIHVYLCGFELSLYHYVAMIATKIGCQTYRRQCLVSTKC